MAIGPPTLGAKEPLVTFPSASPLSPTISQPSRAGARPSSSKPNSQPRRSVCQFLLKARGAGESVLLAAALGDRPGQARLNRRGGLVNIVSVEAEPGLEPQRIPRAETDRHDVLEIQQGARHLFGSIGGNGDFETVLARIAGPAHMAANAVQRSRRRLHASEPRRRRTETVHDPHGGGALKRDERAIIHRRKRNAGGKMRAHMRIIDLLARRIDDQHQLAVLFRRGRASHHQIIDDAARLIHQLCVALLARTQSGNLAGDKRFQRGRRLRMARTAQHRLSHMGDVEQPRGLTRMQMFLDQPLGKGHRHLVAGEGHHLCTQLDMQGVERRALKACLGRISIGRRHYQIHEGKSSTAQLIWTLSPLCRTT